MFCEGVGGREPRLLPCRQIRQRLPELLADQAGRNPVLTQLADHLLMFRDGFLPQFAHVPEQGELALRFHVAEIVQRRMHRGRIGVVGIYDEGVGAGADHLRTVVVRHESRDGGDGVSARHPEVVTHRQGGEHVGGVVGADQVRRHEVLAQPDAQERLFRRGRQDLRVLIRNAVAEGMAGLLRGHFPQVGVILVQEDERASVAAEPVVKLTFGGLDAFEGTETQQVGTADVGDQAVVRSADLDELGDVVGVAGPHFDDGNLRPGRDGQQRQGHADVVVEIALRGRDTVFPGQDGGNEVLGRGLAVGAGQADHRQFPLPYVRTVPDGQFAQRGERVFDPDQSFVMADLRVMIHDRPGGAGIQRLEGVVVSVEILSAQGEEDFPAPDGPAVGGDAAAAGQIFGIQFFHTWFYLTPVLPNPPAPRPDSASSATSSHSITSCRASTSWAMRSPRSITNASALRLTRITQTSPR